MCGIIGVYHYQPYEPVKQAQLEKMLASIEHRGPDEFGIYLEKDIGLGNARLSIIDIAHGTQPICNEEKNIWIVFNGEIFNYIELRAELESKGHRFSTHTDTEVIVHLYEEYGTDCLNYLNGQFVFAIWDKRETHGNGRLFLARDRIGIHPLFYNIVNGKLIFASEIKAIITHPEVKPKIAPQALAETFTLWSPLGANSIFQNILSLEPGHYMLIQGSNVSKHQYWSLNFPNCIDLKPKFNEGEYAEQLQALLWDATSIRLRADVPVGAYLSGGLDSSAITALIHSHRDTRLTTFSIAFRDPNYDERSHQKRMIEYLGTDHHWLECGYEDVANSFPDVIWHTECPIMRTSPAPMFLLSKLVRESGLKVVLTGEGADEYFGGYNIFKEAKLRRFWARFPDSKSRPQLLQRLYPYIKGLSQTGAFLQAFFSKHLTETERSDYSHIIRWENNANLTRMFSADLLSSLNAYDPTAVVRSRLVQNPSFANWHHLNQAQYIETDIFMSNYLLSSQSDRMLMANSVEGRFPFLDHRIIEFSNDLPAQIKINGLKEKYILKKSVQNILPLQILERPKQPYRAPIHRSFLGDKIPQYVSELLSEEKIKAYNYFNPKAVSALVKKGKATENFSERDNMALAGILSTQLVHYLFVENNRKASGAKPLPPLKVCLGAGVSHDQY